MEIAWKQHISSKTEQELNGNLTSQTNSLNKPFFKSIFYSQDKHYKTPLLLPTQKEVWKKNGKQELNQLHFCQ